VRRREVDAVTRRRISEHVRWWVAKVDGRKQADVVDACRKKGYLIDDSTVSRVYRGTFLSLGLDVFLALHRGLEIDAQHMLEYEPFWSEVPVHRRRLKDASLKA
jgi:hypothetical protein